MTPPNDDDGRISRGERLVVWGFALVALVILISIVVLALRS